MKNCLIVMLISLPMFILAGCSTSYQSFIEDVSTEHENPEEIFNALKEAELDDEEDAVRLQASVVHFSLKTQAASFKEEAQKLLGLVDQSEIDLNTADHGVQTMVYLSALSYGNNKYNNEIDPNIKTIVDELCIPANKLSSRMDDTEKLIDVYYAHHLAQACQAVLHDRSAARNITLALIIRQESCPFSGQTSRYFLSELLECRLRQSGVEITGLLPNKEGQ